MNEVVDHAGRPQPPGFPQYSEYRETGIEWLARIPSHWEIKPLKHMATFSTGWTPPTGREDLYGGEHLWANISDLGPKVLDSTKTTITDEAVREARLRIVEAGSLLFSFKLSIGAVSITGEDMYTNEAIAAFLPSPLIDTGYLFWAGPILIPRNAQENIYGAPLLSRERIDNAYLLRPTPSEQRAIAAFLDHETEKIDALVAKKERLIQLLQEKRTTLIARAVTRGLDPNVPMQDSGVECLGQIPAHWEQARVWRLCSATSGATPTKDNPAYWNGNIPWVSPKDMKRRLIDTSRDLITQRALEETGIRLVDPGAVLVVVRGMILAHSFPVALATAPVTVNQDMKALRLVAGIDTSYFAWTLDGLARGIIATVVEEAAHGTRAIRMDQWRNVVCPVPPYSEQLAIAHFLDRATVETDALIAKIYEAIDHLHELRTALISAAVTGKIDVREAKPQ